MDPLQARILEDLGGVLQGEVRCDAVSVSMYATDASLYEVAPLAVTYPRDVEDVMAIVRYAGETGLPLLARGAGTGLAGESLGAGIVVDFSRHMQRIERIDDDLVRVEPGVVHERLNAFLRPSGRYFAPDPSGTAVTTVGSMLAIDAAGSHAVSIGSVRDHTVSLELITADGQRIEAARENLKALRADVPLEGDAAHTRKRELVSKLAKMLTDHREMIDARQPSDLPRNRSGYFLRGVLRDGELDLPRLLVGSEGTLALFTAATFRVLPLPDRRTAALFMFPQLEDALAAVQTVLTVRSSACDLLDRRLLSLARDANTRFEELIPREGEAALIVEFSEHAATGDNPIQELERRMKDAGIPFEIAVRATTNHEVDMLWTLPHTVVPLLNRLHGSTRPLPFVEDIAVPPECIGPFLKKAQRVLQKHHTTASLYAHAASGQLHLRPFLAIPNRETAPQLEELARELYEAVFEFGGSISGEHGLGLARTAFLRSQYGPMYRLFQEVKGIFDPHNLLNPGKIVSDDPHLTVKHLRGVDASGPVVQELQLRWTPEQMAVEARACNGCGTCKSREPQLRMCPFFRDDQIEEAGPRAKANVMRRRAEGELSPEDLTSPELKRLADNCFNCKQCQLECPTRVNIPHLAIEAKAAYVAVHGLRMNEWLLSRIHSLGPVGCRFSRLLNPALNNRMFRWSLERFFGVSRRRKLPPFARRPFLAAAPKRLLERPIITREHKPVIVFLDHYANFHDHSPALAIIALLEQAGCRVHVPPGQVRSGMAMVSNGDLDAARVLAERNIRELSEFARDGCPIVCIEPSSVVCLKMDYPVLLDHPDVAAVADAAIEAGRFLESLRIAGRLSLDLKPLSGKFAYHMPCHLRALGEDSPLQDLVAWIPELDVHAIDQGCSGMAGTYGIHAENFDRSLRMGAGLMNELRENAFSGGFSECSSCRMQMMQATDAPVVHPLVLLAYSAGLLPEKTKLLKRNHKALLTS